MVRFYTVYIFIIRGLFFPLLHLLYSTIKYLYYFRESKLLEWLHLNLELGNWNIGSNISSPIWRSMATHGYTEYSLLLNETDHWWYLLSINNGNKASPLLVVKYLSVTKLSWRHFPPPFLFQLACRPDLAWCLQIGKKESRLISIVELPGKLDK